MMPSDNPSAVSQVPNVLHGHAMPDNQQATPSKNSRDRTSKCERDLLANLNNVREELARCAYDTGQDCWKVLRGDLDLEEEQEIILKYWEVAPENSLEDR